MVEVRDLVGEVADAPQLARRAHEVEISSKVIVIKKADDWGDETGVRVQCAR